MVFIYRIFLLKLKEQFELKLFFRRRKREVLIRGQIIEIHIFNIIKKMDNLIVSLGYFPKSCLLYIKLIE